MEENKIAFGDVYYSPTDKFEEVEEEVFEVTKGRIRTTITIRFNKEGYPLSYHFESEKKPTGRFIVKRPRKPTKLKPTKN